MFYLVPAVLRSRPAWSQGSFPWAKRVLDLLITVPALVLLSPVFLTIAALIRLNSEGPIFYVSERAGREYRTFPLYKFRTMYTDADARLPEIIHRSEYAMDDTPPPLQTMPLEVTTYERCVSSGKTVLVDDREMVDEDEYQRHQSHASNGVFFKLQDDPRVTPVGRWLRRLSLDELPQFFNVLKGDMSLVGNRPLPLYEAEELTRDGHVKRFLAPAGITGLWQVRKRGAETSYTERIQLDLTYAEQYSLWMDLWIILRTLPALLQPEEQ